MHKRDTVANELIALFAEELHVEVPSAGTDLIAAGLIDSVNFVELLLCLERTFGVFVDMKELELEDFRSVEGIAAFVAQHRPAGSQAPAENATISE